MNRIHRIGAVTDFVGMGKSTLAYLISLGKFPRPIHLGARAVGWLESDIQKWIEDRTKADTAASHAPTEQPQPRRKNGRKAQAVDAAKQPKEAQPNRKPATSEKALESTALEPAPLALTPTTFAKYEERVCGMLEAYPRAVVSASAQAAVGRAVERIKPRWGMSEAQALEYLAGLFETYAQCVAGWPESQRAFVPGVERWLDESQYEQDTAMWRRVGNAREQGHDFDAQLLPSGEGQGNGHHAITPGAGLNRAKRNPRVL